MQKCALCDGQNLTKIGKLANERTPWLVLSFGICKDCGLVTIFPWPSSKTYQRINQEWYAHKFSDDPIKLANTAYKFGKWRIMWRRISPFYSHRSLKTVLDVGAGQGWAIEFLQTINSEIIFTAIEQWKPSQEHIKENLKSEVLDVDINSEWSKSLNKKYDLVIFRHTLEHLESPNRALEQIRNSLSPDGMAYIVVPNLEQAIGRRPMRTDFFRPVHLHYFSPGTFLSMLKKNGLEPVTYDHEGEIWGLFRASECQIKLPDEYSSMSKQLDHWKIRSCGIDSLRCVKIWMRLLLPNPFIKFVKKTIGKPR